MKEYNGDIKKAREQIKETGKFKLVADKQVEYFGELGREYTFVDETGFATTVYLPYPENYKEEK